MKRIHVALGLAALASIHFALVFDVLRRTTPTVDEIAHLPAGLSYIQKGTFKVYPHNPPLARMAPALAISHAPPQVHYDGTYRNHRPPNHWLFAFSFLEVNTPTESSRERYLSAFTEARTVVAVWSALTIPILYAWGSRWLGGWAGWLAATLWTFCPNLIAHAGLVTTDLAATSTGFIASYAYSRWLDRRSWRWAAAAGLLLGLAQLTKFSEVWLVPIWTVWAILDRLHAGARSIGAWSPLGLATTSAGRQWGVTFLLALLTINVGYGFEGAGEPMGKFPFLSQTLTRARTPRDGAPDDSSNRTYNEVYQRRVNRFRGTLLANIPCPLPYWYVDGFDQQMFEAESKYQMYLRGRFTTPLKDDVDETGAWITPTERRGWSYYYLYALALKVPLSTWLLFVIGLVVWPRLPTTWPNKTAVVLLVVAPLASMSLLTDINLGLRYVLPIFPFLFLIASATVAEHAPAWRKYLTAIAVAANVVEVARIHPHELSYFNEAAGRPENWRWHLIDSNIDWGQDLRNLSRWLDAHPDWKKDVRLAYMGTVPPEFEGIADYRLAPRDLRHVPPPIRLPSEHESDPRSYGPQPGKYAVSVNFERGLRFHTPSPRRLLPQILAENKTALMPSSSMLWAPTGAYSYFQYFKPIIDPTIGYSILLYDVSLEDANRVRREMGFPELPAAKKE